MKTDTIFYQLYRRFPQFFFELIGRPDVNLDRYQFQAQEIKQQGFRQDGLFLPLPEYLTETLYFLEVHFYKAPDFYDRLFPKVMLYLGQYQPPQEHWQIIILYGRHRHEEPPPARYHYLMERYVQRFYLEDEILKITNPIAKGIYQLILQTPKQARTVAPELVQQVKTNIKDQLNQVELLELIETIATLKYPELSWEELKAMLGLSDLIKDTRAGQDIYAAGLHAGREEGRQEGREEGRQEGLQVGVIEGKLKVVSVLLDLGMSIDEVAERLELDIEVIRKTIES